MSEPSGDTSMSKAASSVTRCAAPFRRTRDAVNGLAHDHAGLRRDVRDSVRTMGTTLAPRHRRCQSSRGAVLHRPPA